MPYYAQLTQDRIAVAVTQTSGRVPPDPLLVEIDGLHNGLLGKLYDAEASAAAGRPTFVDAPALPQPASAWEWLIDIGPFFDRFGAAKMAVLTSSDVGVQAILKDTQVRKWIDLKHPDVASSIAYIGIKVPALTAKLQSAILNTPVAEHENLALRKLYFS